MRTSLVSLLPLPKAAPARTSAHNTMGLSPGASAWRPPEDRFIPGPAVSHPLERPAGQPSSIRFGAGGSNSASGEFGLEINGDKKAALKALRKWQKKANKAGDASREKIAGNLIAEISDQSGDYLITAKSKKELRAVGLLQVPPNATYAMLVDLVSSGEKEAKGSGKVVLEQAQQIARATGRSHITLYAYTQGVADYYTKKLNFEFSRNIPGFPNGIYALAL